MLASLLPGFRDLRTPLVTGYLYLLVTWLVFGEWLLGEGADNELAERGHRLFDLAGRPAIAIAVSFGAYLLGSLLAVRDIDKVNGWIPSNFRARSELNDQVRSWISTRTQDAASRGVTLDDYGSTKHMSFELTRGLQEGRENLPPPLSSEDQSQTHEAVGFVFQHALEWCVLREKDQMIARLQKEHELVWNDYDRHRSEAELRFSISVPLILLTVVASCLWTPFALLGLTVPIMLLRQGVSLVQEANDKVWHALINGTISSPAMNEFQGLTG